MMKRYGIKFTLFLPSFITTTGTLRVFGGPVGVAGVEGGGGEGGGGWKGSMQNAPCTCSTLH